MARNFQLHDHVLRPAPEPTIETLAEGDSVVVALGGECDRYCVAELRDALDDAVRGPADMLVVDLSETTFVDSSVLGTLVSVHQELEGGRRMAIVVPDPALRRVFEIAGLDLLFPVHASVEAAMTDGDGVAGPCAA